MSRRTLVILAVVAAGLLLLAVLAERTDAPPPQTSELVLPTLAERLNDLERVTVAKAGNEIVATLERGETGWSVAEREGYPADVGKLRQALLALGEAQIVERKTANPDLYDRLGVEDVSADEASGLAISFAGAGVEVPTLIVGDAEGTSYRYVRRAADEQSYLIDRNPTVPRETAQWLDPVILDVRGDRVQEVTIAHPDGERVRVFKDDAEQANFSVADVPEGRQLQYPGVANVIGNSLRELNLEDVERAAEAGDQPVTTIEFKTFDGLVVRANGFERDDAGWVTFEASVDPEHAARFDASETAGATGEQAAEAEASADASAPSGGTDTSAAEPTERSPAEEAADIQSRVAGWRYRIPSYQYEQMTRRLSDLLQEPPAEE